MGEKHHLCYIHGRSAERLPRLRGAEWDLVLRGRKEGGGSMRPGSLWELPHPELWDPKGFPRAGSKYPEAEKGEVVEEEPKNSPVTFAGPLLSASSSLLVGLEK